MKHQCARKNGTPDQWYKRGYIPLLWVESDKVRRSGQIWKASAAPRPIGGWGGDEDSKKQNKLDKKICEFSAKTLVEIAKSINPNFGQIWEASAAFRPRVGWWR